MRLRKILFAVALLLGICQAHAREIWLSGLDQITRARKEPGAASDFMLLFEPGAPWTAAEKKVHVLKVSTPFLLNGSEEDLRKAFAGLKERNIRLGVETGFLSGDGVCGKGMEGFAAAGTAAVLAARVKRLGGDLSYVAMDAPLWFGRYANSKTACHWEISAIAHQVAEGVAMISRSFPSVKVGDIEPLGVPATIPWMNDISQWSEAYRSATGTKLAFLHADVQWRGDWQSQLKAASHFAADSGMQFGVIINSNYPDNNDNDWTENAKGRLTAVRSDLGSLPDQVIVQSWTVAPRRFLPETQPGTLTNLVDSVRD